MFDIPPPFVSAPARDACHARAQSDKLALKSVRLNVYGREIVFENQGKLGYVDDVNDDVDGDRI
jgi:hypothetical protein